MKTNKLDDFSFRVMTKLALLALLGIAHGYFVTVQPRKEECFHEYVKNGDKINMMYEVSSLYFLHFIYFAFRSLREDFLISMSK